MKRSNLRKRLHNMNLMKGRLKWLKFATTRKNTWRVTFSISLWIQRVIVDEKLRNLFFFLEKCHNWYSHSLRRCEFKDLGHLQHWLKLGDKRLLLKNVKSEKVEGTPKNMGCGVSIAEQNTLLILIMVGKVNFVGGID